MQRAKVTPIPEKLRATADGVIQVVLDKHAKTPCATDADLHRALGDAYPFPRRTGEHWRAWSAAVNAAVKGLVK